MQQKLEEYIAQHREHLDVEPPGDRVWREISGNLDKKSRPLWRRYPLIQAAAALLLLGMVAGLWWNFRDSLPQQSEMTVADLPAVKLPSSIDDWRKAEKEYQQEIQSLLKEIQTYSIEWDQKAKAILQKVGKINDRLAELKAKMARVDYDSEKAADMLSLYQAKVDCLEELRDHLKDR